jgi:peroxiredoxin Q/BCP
VGISTDTVDKQAHFAQQRAFDYPLLSDEDGVVCELFGVRRGRLAKLRKSVVGREAARGGRHTRRRGLLARLLPVRRTTFVIDTDRTILKVVSNELRASVHADQALWFLQNHSAPHSSPTWPGKAHRRASAVGAQGRTERQLVHRTGNRGRAEPGPAIHADGRPYRQCCPTATRGSGRSAQHHCEAAALAEK